MTQEAVARSVVRQVIKGLIPPASLVSQQVQVGRQHILRRLFATKQVSAAGQKRAQEQIAQRAGRETDLSVSTVASQTELQEMLTKLSSAEIPVISPPSPPPPLSLEEAQKQLLARVTPVLNDVWPHAVPLAGFDLTLSQSKVSLDARYESVRALTPISVSLIAKQLQEKLNLPGLLLEAHRVPVSRHAAKPGKQERKAHEGGTT